MSIDSNNRIAIRTYASSRVGIGHLVRMRHLATVIRQLGVDLLFVMDHPDQGLNEMLEGLDVCYLSETALEQVFDQHEDARQMINLLAGSSVQVVVVDDYRLNAIWEIEIQQAGYRVVSVDDTATRSHQCDLLIDQKWRGEGTSSHYRDLVPEKCKRLLGPDYALLSPEYRELPKHLSIPTEEPFKVLFSLGGGGDLNVLAELVESLIQQPGYEANQMVLQVVIGPSSQNRERLLGLAEQGVVELLIGKQSLFTYFCSASLVVGAAGGSVYELARLHVPVISFSMSENQQTSQCWLDDVGHYLHLPGCSAEDVRRLAQLIVLIKGQYPRIQQLFSDSKVELDGKGAERVAAEICQLLPDVVGSQLSLIEPPLQNKIEEQGYQLRPVEDRDINHYLQSRNLKLNRGNMIEEQAIRPIVHYRWWLQTKRDSFLLTKGGEPKLYIWQECVEIMEGEYWIGGWFVCGEGCQYQDTLYALSKQLEWTDKYHRKIPWIAVISRENHFVKLLNQHQGVTEVEQGSKRGAVIAAAFPKASFEKFYFVTRDTL